MKGLDREHFASVYQNEPTVAESAPGRVNLMGEHTDYHQGFVLPTVLLQRTTISLRPRADQLVRVTSREMPGGVAEFVLGTERRRGNWLDYVQGVTAVANHAGFRLTGFDASITSTIPSGAGVSSSAALTVGLLRALRTARMVSVDDLAVAQFAQLAETDFVGAPVGIMDQMACSLGRLGEALFIDTRSLRYERIPLPTTAGLIVINSGIAHQHAGGAYRQRRQESFQAAEALGVQWLRDAPQDAPDTLTPNGLLRRRATHIISENQRVLDAVDALRERDVLRVGHLFRASHRSQRDDYETSTPEIDTLVDIGEHDSAVYGARLTGGGFGGAVVMLASMQCAAAAATRILDKYEDIAGRQGAILSPCPLESSQGTFQCA
jgi:galactokinase